MNRGGILRLGNPDDARESMFVESITQAGARQLSCETLAPVGPCKVIDNFRRTRQRSQAAESHKLAARLFFDGPTAKSVSLPMRDDAMQRLLAHGSVFRFPVLDITHYVGIV